MPATPVWLLDVDGVLNAGSKKPDQSVWPADAWTQFDATDTRSSTTWPMLIAKPVVEFIAAVHHQGRAEIRWHTTWQSEAHAIADEVGLPHFEVHDCPEWDYDGVLGYWWKLPAAKRVLEEEQRPLIWTDDDATLGRLAPSVLDTFKGWPNLLIAPQGNIGLTRKHLRLIDEHLDLLARQHATT